MEGPIENETYREDNITKEKTKVTNMRKWLDQIQEQKRKEKILRLSFEIMRYG